MTDDALPFPIESPLLSDSAAGVIAHGFFTRQGGVSQGIYQSLNVGLGSQDERAAIAENRRRVAAWFGQASERLATVNQVHSPRAVRVDDSYRGERPEADALVTATPAWCSASCRPIAAPFSLRMRRPA